MFYTKHCNSLLTDKSLRPAISLLRLLAIVTAVLVFALSSVKAQEEVTGQTSEAKTSPTIPAGTRPVRTDSPRDTLTTFLRLRDSLETALLDYRAERSVDSEELIRQRRAHLAAVSAVQGTCRSQPGGAIVT